MSVKPWGGGEVGITGDDAVQARLLTIAGPFPEIAARALVAEAEFEGNDASEHAPIGGDDGTKDHDPHIGALRGSKRVIPSVEHGDLTVTIVFGGSDVPYAILQHQKLSYRHPHGGAADYLLGVVTAAARGGSMLNNVAARVEDELRGLGAA